MTQLSFFDFEESLTRQSGLGDQLEVFRPDLEKTLAYSDGSKGRRLLFDPVLMFRVLMTQTDEIDSLFECFDVTLLNARYLPRSGQILDATLVKAPYERRESGP